MNARSGPERPLRRSTGETTGPIVAHPTDNRRRRRTAQVWESTRFSRYLQAVYQDFDHYTDPDAPLCRGGHHPGLACDYWGVCSGMNLGIAEREHVGAALREAGWTP